MSQHLQGFSAKRLQKLAASVSNVVASLHEHKMLSNQVAKVIVSISNDRCTASEIASAITRAVGSGFAPVLNSFRPIPGANCIALAGFVTKNSEVILATEDKFKTMKPVTASIMLDPQDSSMWDLRNGPQGSFLVRAGEEDLGSLLLTASVRNVNAPRMREMASCSTDGEFVSYVNPVTGALGHGFVLASDGDMLEVVNDEDELPVLMGEDSIVEAAALHNEDKVIAAKVGITAADFDSRSKAAMTDYYKQLYSYAPQYLADIVAQIDAHAAV